MFVSNYPIAVLHNMDDPTWFQYPVCFFKGALPSIVIQKGVLCPQIHHIYRSIIQGNTTFIIMTYSRYLEADIPKRWKAIRESIQTSVKPNELAVWELRGHIL